MPSLILKSEGEKILIGDNLSFHLSCDAIKACQAVKANFVFLPSNTLDPTTRYGLL